MKRNKFIKIACAMLVMCLLTTCVVGTTLAKYITNTSASDTARVAKWGVEVSASGTMFGKAYQDTIVTDGETSATVQSNNNGSLKVVAPGTKNETGIQIKLSGTPEVEFKVVAAQVDDVNDIFLKAGEYGVMVAANGVNYATDFGAEKIYYFNGTEYVKANLGYYTANISNPNVKYYKLTDEATVNEPDVDDGTYYPIVWTGKVKSGGTNGGTTGDTTGEAAGEWSKDYATLQAAVTALTSQINAIGPNDNGIFKANDTINNVYTLTWAWAYEGNNGADTILGNLMAKEQGDDIKVVKLSGDKYVDVISDDYSLNVGGGFKVTATQVD